MRRLLHFVERGAFGLVAVVVGGLLVLGGMAGWIALKVVEGQRLEGGVVVTATVVERVAERAAVVRYDAEAGQRRSRLDSATWNLDADQLQVGSRIRVVYDKRDPGRLWVLGDGGDTRRWWTAVGVGVFLALFGFVVRFADSDDGPHPPGASPGGV